jgi:hypothetical protein
VARSSALERLLAIHGGGTRTTATIQVRLEDPTYDTVGEEDYVALVDRCHKDTTDFIIDEDSQEEDWTHSALPTKTEGSI